MWCISTHRWSSWAGGSSTGLHEISGKAYMSHFEPSAFRKLIALNILRASNRWHFDVSMCTAGVEHHSLTISCGVPVWCIQIEGWIVVISISTRFQYRCHRWSSFPKSWPILCTNRSQIWLRTKVLHGIIHQRFSLRCHHRKVIYTIDTVDFCIGIESQPGTISMRWQVPFSHLKPDRLIIVKQPFSYISVGNLARHQRSSYSWELEALWASRWIAMSILILMFEYFSQFLLLDLMFLQVFDSYATWRFGAHYSSKDSLVFLMDFPKFVVSLTLFNFRLIISLLRNVSTWSNKMVRWNVKHLSWFLLADAADLLFEWAISIHYSFYSFEENTVGLFDISCSIFLHLHSFSIWNWNKMISLERIPRCAHFIYFVSMQLIIFIVLYCE